MVGGWRRLTVGSWQLAVGGWWLAAIDGWQLTTGGWWRLVVVRGGLWLVIGGWWRLVVVGRWRLVAAGGWRRLAAIGGSWELAVGGPLGRSLRVVLNKKKTGSLRTALPAGQVGGLAAECGGGPCTPQSAVLHLRPTHICTTMHNVSTNWVTLLYRCLCSGDKGTVPGAGPGGVCPHAPPGLPGLQGRGDAPVGPQAGEALGAPPGPWAGSGQLPHKGLAMAKQ